MYAKKKLNEIKIATLYILMAILKMDEGFFSLLNFNPFSSDKYFLLTSE